MHNTNSRRVVNAAATTVLAAGLLVAGAAVAQAQTETSAGHRITTTQQLTEHLQFAVATEREQSTGNETYCGNGRSELTD